MKHSLLCALLFLCVTGISAQTATINDPIIIAPSQRCYIASDGSDSNSGDSLSPMATFSAALDKLNTLTGSVSGNVYGEVVLFPGTYVEIFQQPYSKYQIGSKYMNVSLRGKGSVILDGTSLTVNPGSGMISLLGSNIQIKNIKINYSSDIGIRFGYNYSGIVINSHDIWIDSVDIDQTGSHGILCGIGALNANGSSTLIPRAKRFKITNTNVHGSVNFNTPQSQWGSAVKFWNASHIQALNNHVYDNSGEGIDFDFCDTALISGNLLHDNYANVYLDKMQYAVVEKNHIYNESKVVSGVLMGLEAFTSYVTDHYMKDIYIQNNIIHNTMGINIWQGAYSAIQNGIFSNIQIRHNTIIGKQVANGAQVSFSYTTFLGQPVANVSFTNISIDRNIMTANVDSLNNGNMISIPLDPQPGLVTGYNLFNRNPGFGYNAVSDQIVATLPVYVDAATDVISELTPSSVQHPDLVMSANNACSLTDDFSGSARSATTNVGAIERNDQLSLSESNEQRLVIYPNPTIDKIWIVGIEKVEGTLVVTDLFGRECLHADLSQVAKSGLSLSQLKKGAYLVSIFNEQKLQKSERIILQ